MGFAAKLSLGAGVVVLLIAALWTPIAVPAMVKFPTSTNVRVAYAGTLVTYMNAKTGAPLVPPATTKLTIDRHLQALASESTSAVALVKETIVLHAGAATTTELNVYALNRRSMKPVADPRAFTFVPGNTPSRGSSYYVTLPMGLTSTTHVSLWKPESATTYPLRALGAPTSATPSKLDGLGVLWFTGTLKMTPAPAYERSGLAARGLPMSLTPTEVEGQLAAAGVSITKLGAAVAPVLTPSQLKTLLTVLSKPVALQYYIFGSGELAAEPRTGMIVKLQDVIDGVAAKSDPAPMQAIVSVLDQHLAVPGVPAAVAAIRRVGNAPPVPVYELRYTETPAAVATSVTLARNQIGQINITTRDIPIGLGVLGLILVGLATFGSAFRRRRAATGAGALEPTGSGSRTGQQAA